MDSLPTGGKLSRIRRIFFVLRESIDSSEGPIELTFTDSQSYLFECGSDGEELVVSQKRWSDPFADPVSKENEHYLLRHGKWEAFDLSATPWSYHRFIGQTLTQIVRHSESRITLIFERSSMEIEAKTDELHVLFP